MSFIFSTAFNEEGENDTASNVTKDSTTAHKPSIIGSIPLIGCAFEFGKDPMRFLKETQAKNEQDCTQYGDVFTLKLPGKKLTFLMQEESFDLLFATHDAVSFQDGVQLFTERVFGISHDSFYNHHQKFLTFIKTKLAPNNLEKHILNLGASYSDAFKSWPHHGEMTDALQTIRKTMFSSAFQTIFGFKPSHFTNENEDLLYWTFLEMDEQFELAASPIPHLLLSRFTRSKNQLLTILRKFIQEGTSVNNHNPPIQQQQHQFLLAQDMIHFFDGGDNHHDNHDDSTTTIREESKENWLLALLWALQVNSLNATFWTISRILTDSQALNKVLNELKDAQLMKFDSVANIPTISGSKLKELPYILCCIQESIRLHSPGMVIRKVVKDFVHKDYLIEKGSDICGSIYLTHHDESLFPEPYRFWPERFSKESKQPFKDHRFAHIPFGAGPYKCPGQHFAIIEIQLFVAMFFQWFSLSSPKERVPPHIKHRIIGIQHPSEPFPIMYYKKVNQ